LQERDCNFKILQPKNWGHAQSLAHDGDRGTKHNVGVSCNTCVIGTEMKRIEDIIGTGIA
jgi:hypothetical protein